VDVNIVLHVEWTKDHVVGVVGVVVGGGDGGGGVNHVGGTTKESGRRHLRERKQWL
jgi:hypothetical protein